MSKCAEMLGSRGVEQGPQSGLNNGMNAAREGQKLRGGGGQGTNDSCKVQITFSVFLFVSVVDTKSTQESKAKQTNRVQGSCLRQMFSDTPRYSQILPAFYSCPSFMLLKKRRGRPKLLSVCSCPSASLQFIQNVQTFTNSQQIHKQIDSDRQSDVSRVERHIISNTHTHVTLIGLIISGHFIYKTITVEDALSTGVLCPDTPGFVMFKVMLLLFSFLILLMLRDDYITC